ncbi:MAG: hypothetical protein KC502_04275 [Myxococcales bacterium]|nr:hypothetical protein [Myxococcales bacterium]
MARSNPLHSVLQWCAAKRRAQRGRQRLRLFTLTLIVAAGLPLLTAPAPSFAAESWQVQVVDIGAAGLPKPASATTVELVTFRASGGDKPAAEVSSVKLTADPQGVVQVPPPAPGTHLKLRFREEGQTVTSPIRQTGQRVGRYSQPLSAKDISLDVRANLEVRDSGLRVWSLYTFRAEKPGVLRWTDKASLALPLLAPVVRNTVLDRGAIPNAARHVEVTVEGDGTITKKDGSLMLTGTLAPGRPISVRVRYPISVKRGPAQLGLRGTVGQTHLAVAAIGVRPTRPRVLADKPARSGRQNKGKDRMAGLALIQPIALGEVAKIWITDLPEAAALPRKALAGTALLLAMLALAAILRRRG